MGANFYEILGINIDASEADIRAAFIQLSRKYHSDEAPTVNSKEKFELIVRAFKVLKDKTLKEQYDKQFSKASPETDQSVSAYALPSPTKAKDSPKIHDVSISLEEINEGCTKYFDIVRNILLKNGKKRSSLETVAVHVKAGCEEGTKTIFEYSYMGDERPIPIPADAIFVIRSQPHPVFKREKNDLRYKANISLNDALCGTEITVPTLKPERSLNLQLSGITRPDQIHIFVGEGLVLPSNPTHKGNIIVEFNIVYPSELTADCSAILHKMLWGL